MTYPQGCPRILWIKYLTCVVNEASSIIANIKNIGRIARNLWQAGGPRAFYPAFGVKLMHYIVQGVIMSELKQQVRNIHKPPTA